MLESKRRAAIFLLLAFLLASVAAYLVYEKVKNLNAELGGMTKVYVAGTNIPVREPIQENQITTMDIPNKFVNEGFIKNKDDLLNMVSVVPLSKEEIITKNMIKPYSNLREENNRLVAMYPSEKVQFDQIIETLDRVDIIVSTENKGQTKTEIFMRDVPVAFAQGKGDKFAGVALEVKMEDAPKLIHIQNYADKVRVLKANVGKEDPPQTAGQTKAANQTKAAQPAPAAKTAQPVTNAGQTVSKPAAAPNQPKTSAATNESKNK
ncbi:flp pilus assembly protein CpaB [Peribacillus saganii]|uniref:Flp pilus assembly protein CpaB n=1 Tax=Peribacillus saganii TaxID=2303992 RepID=A0A372LMF4_9BACI|nr:SAF domain-containing protein [Peribacillus saganii]RFU67759.1 flp pilus assembly protein CpaB [Peribacillus saganii]